MALGFSFDPEANRPVDLASENESDDSDVSYPASLSNLYPSRIEALKAEVKLRSSPLRSTQPLPDPSQEPPSFIPIKRSATLSFDTNDATAQYMNISQMIYPPPSAPLLPSTPSLVPAEYNTRANQPPRVKAVLKTIDESEVYVGEASSVHSGSTLGRSLGSLSSETLNTLSSENEVAAFLTVSEDDSTELPNANTRDALRPPLARKQSDSHSILAKDGRVLPHLAKLPLDSFCALIPECKSLERAQILSVECYRVQSGVYHRFLLFHLRRPARSEVWLRVDRRTAGLKKLIFKFGKTIAKDSVEIGVSKDELIGSELCVKENVLTFDESDNPAKPFPILGEFKFFLDVIRDELKEYKLWPDNCWFFCSVLQEHLHDSGSGKYTEGSAIVAHVAPLIRNRITARVYHEPAAPPDNQKLLELLMEEPQHKATAILSMLKNASTLARRASHFPLKWYEPRVEGTAFKSLADQFQHLAMSSNLGLRARCLIAARAVAIYRHLYYARPDEDHHDGFCKVLNTYVPQLRETRRELEAAYCMLEVVEARRAQYQRNKAYAPELLDSLTEYAERLSSLHRYEEACTIHSEIVEVYQSVYAKKPSSHHFQLAAYRRDYAQRLSALGRHNEACEQEAAIVEMAQSLYQGDATHHDILADCLNAYAERLASMGRLDDACSERLKLVKLEHTLYRLDNQTHLRAFVAALTKYINALDRAGQPETACQTSLDVANVYHDACVHDPNVYRDDAMASIEAYVGRLTSLGREADTCSHLAELVQHARALFDQDPHRHLFRFSHHAEVYIRRLVATGDLSGAGRETIEAITIYHDLWRSAPSDEHLNHLITKADALHQTLRNAGCASKASGILVDVRRELYTKNPADTSARLLCNRLVAHAHDLELEGRFEEAADAAVKAAAVMRSHPLPAQSSESRVRAEQLFYCAQHVAYARRYDEALNIASESVKSAKDVDPNDAELQGWAQRWIPKTERKVANIQQVASKKNHQSRLREAKMLGLTYQRDSDLDEQKQGISYWPFAAVVALVVAIALGLSLRLQH